MMLDIQQIEVFHEIFEQLIRTQDLVTYKTTLAYCH